MFSGATGLTPWFFVRRAGTFRGRGGGPCRECQRGSSREEWASGPSGWPGTGGPRDNPSGGLRYTSDGFTRRVNTGQPSAFRGGSGERGGLGRIGRKGRPSFGATAVGDQAADADGGPRPAKGVWAHVGANREGLIFAETTAPNSCIGLLPGARGCRHLRRCKRSDEKTGHSVLLMNVGGGNRTPPGVLGSDTYVGTAPEDESTAPGGRTLFGRR